MTDKPFEKAIQGLETGPEASDAAETSAGVASDVPPNPAVDALRAKFGDAIINHLVYSGDEHCVYVVADRCYDVLKSLKQDGKFDLLLDLTAIDYGGGRPLEVVYQLYSIPNKQMLRVKAPLSLDSLEIGTVETLWKTANWLEREVFDLFGINFLGHSDMRRILMPENYAEGHPLRKDFPLRGRFSRAEQTRRSLAFEVADYYTPEEMDIGGEPVAAREGNASNRAASTADMEAADDARQAAAESGGGNE